MLPQCHRLRRSEDIRHVRQKGRRWHHPLLILYTCAGDRQSGAAPSRFAISVSRRVGNAVTRNRCKRRVREAIRHVLPQLECGWDCLFVARNDLASASYSEVDEAVRWLFDRADLLAVTADRGL